MVKARWRLLLCLSLGCVAVPALGQTTAAKTLYEAAYFAQYAPSNALEIVRRVPGFTLEVGDQEVRGFGQAAGNVVINGQRPSSKSDTLETILARLPASRVARVEVGPGDLFGSEFAGKAQVANLVLSAGGGVAGTSVGKVRRAFTGLLMPEGESSALIRTGRSSFNLAASFDNDQSTEEGTDRITRLPGGELVEFRRKVNDIRDPNGSLSASWEFNGGANRTAHLNGRFGFDRFALTQENSVTPVVGAVRDDFLTQRYRFDEFEVGGDVSRPLWGGGVKLIGLATRRHRINRDLSLNRIGPSVLGGFAQARDDKRGETVIRLVWNRADIKGWSVETGAEGALNRLDSRVDLFGIAAGGEQTRIDLPVDQAVVEEYRGELFANAGRPLASTLRADFGLTYEASELTVSGDAEAKRALKFLKPKASLDWRPKGGWHFQLAVARTVAQLQFEDFLSTAELANDRVSGGNANLLPQRAWEALLTVERPLLGDGLAKIEIGYDAVSQVQDRVPTPEGFDAPGNLGSGQRYILRSTLDAPLKSFGLKGVRLTAHSSIVKTSVRDPYTLARRNFSGNSLARFDVGVRQDLAQFAWGVTFFGESPSIAYRQNEIDSFFSGLPFVEAFVEYRPDVRTTVTLGLDNALDTPSFRDRTFFTPDRRTREPYLAEARQRNRHMVPYLTVKRSFG